jgi:hypothetical protein
MTENTTRPGLWPIPGEGVLARQGDLILLTSTADDELTDGLLALLEKTADSGGDGRQLADAVADLLAGHPSGPASLDQAGPAVVAFGPAGPGLALTISGAANAEISTPAGTQRLVPGPPGVQLRCLLSEPATAVRSELSTGDTVTGHPDRFSRLDQGTTRAGGLVFVPSTPAAAEPKPAPAAAAEPEPAPAATQPEPEPAATETKPTPATAEPEPEPEAEPAPAATETRLTTADTEPKPTPATGEPKATPATAEPKATPATGEPKATPVGTEAISAPAASEPMSAFEAVLPADPAPDEVEHQPPFSRDPQEPGSPAPPAADAPSVLGVYCKNGHFGDPAARSCAVCGVSMIQKTLVPERAPRPPLGVLAFDDGSIVQLDSDYVIGREPTLNASVAAGQARPLSVVDDAGIVSRAHAALQLDGWRVLITDLGSANGTHLRRAGEAPEQLTPHVAVELPPGSHVDMGGCGFRYESRRRP